MIYAQPAKIGNKSIYLCPLNTQKTRSKGYQNAENGPTDGEGALFVFSEEEPRIFHMKNVAFDLDLLGFNEDGRLVWVIPMTANNKHTYKTLPCKYAAEVPAGWSSDLLIGVSKILFL